ncbi:hypothetical protein [Pelagibacterium limicola]|uniref:hypothetical protein n=1 Tax=Pelagibacterium limicola TaxID=2791022 RepID=UPI0018AFDB5A|nr:hypothetical protein [Pelagibacterium limicola]
MAQEHFAHDARQAIEAQIAELRGQIHSISRSLKGNGLDVDHLRKDAKGLFGGATKNVQRVTHYAQDEAKAVAKVARKNPTGATTALTLAAAIGIGIGYALSQMHHETHQKHWW